MTSPSHPTSDVTAVTVAMGCRLPLVRPLVFAFPGDRTVGDLWNEYMLGPDLLVAPVWRTGERAREVYLPAGAWRSLWDGSVRFDGPVTVTVAVPLDTIAVLG
jgi:alpha-glucosidase (family GH31 glycosyl hydrolase)